MRNPHFKCVIVLHPSYHQIASVVNSALDLYFPEGCGVDILAKLGRYYVTSAFTLAVSIIAKKEVLLDQPGRDGKCQVGSTAPFFPEAGDSNWSGFRGWGL